MDGYEDYEEYTKVLYSRDYQKKIEKDGKVYFLDFRDDSDYGEDEDGPIEEPSPIVTRRKDLDLTDDELEKFKNGTINKLSKKLMDKILAR